MSLLSTETPSLLFRVFGPGLDGWPGHPMLWTSLIAMIAAALAVAAMRSLQRADDKSGGPGFRALASGLDLSRANRRLLGRVAARAGIESPAAILISRGSFDHAVRTASPCSRDARRLRGLRSRIFTDPATLVP